MRAIALCLLCVLFLAAAAETEAATDAFAFHAGSFDTFRGTESSLIGLEYHSEGLMATSGGRSIGAVSLMTGGSITGRLGAYVYLGGRFEAPVGKRVSLAPSFAPGVFFAGRGKSLGGAIEFRSGIEVALRLNDGGAVGLGLFHYSNGTLYTRNPGSEALLGIYRFPVFRKLGL